MARWFLDDIETVTYQSWTAQWYRGAGGRVLRFVITKTACGNIPFRVFFCTDPEVSVDYLLQRYASRWSIEVTFFNLKQYLGFEDSQAWSRRAVERTAPFVAFLAGVFDPSSNSNNLFNPLTPTEFRRESGTRTG